MKKRNIMATSSIAVALFLGSYSSTLAADYTFSRQSTYNLVQNVALTKSSRFKLGVNASDFKEDLGSDPTFTESLVDQGFTPSQIQKIFSSASLKNDYRKMPLSE